ncbi:MAG TPA: Sua5/YciO/YrdC/YwlC family protein, partial [Acidobacteriota bacterium]|nr:Sua5/YciO/YrdC/YwlC family protein [Acidobacteriota bacterium]
MAPFAMCPDCEREYTAPTNRRFHAQPVACPVCGPKVWLETGSNDFSRLATEVATTENAIHKTRALLAKGKIIAIKGLGGFHLACDATDVQSVTELRNRKLRVDKPFALIMPDLETIEKHCFVSESERELLLSTARPIVLLKRKPESNIAKEVAPAQDWLGVMLPYTPLHYLLLEKAKGFPEALVMTSGNISEEPIATDNDEARTRLASLADGFLFHNRDIHIRCDDSVARIFEDNRQSSIVNRKSEIYPIRRSRGYSPFP